MYTIFPKEQPAKAEINTPSANTIKYIVFLCNKYKVTIENDKLIDWKVENIKEIVIKI